MMHKLEDIALAASICQWIDYGFRVLKQAKRLRKRRSTVVELERDTGHLERIAAMLVDVDASDEAIKKLASMCVALTEEIIAKMEALKPKKNKSAWSALTGLARANAEKEELEELERKVELCRTEMEVSFNAIWKEASEELDRLVTSELPAMAELATLRSTVDIIGAVTGLVRLGTPILDMMCGLMERSKEAISRAQQAAVLDLLDFQTIHERFESITEAEASTFSWLLDTRDDDKEKPSTSLDDVLAQARQRFVQWLVDGGSFFYLSGKPGAGKSTLMKFICQHENFHRHLGAWCGESKLLVGRFFFWKPGQPEQKSISGLLRGLLYSILERTPAAAAMAFPQLCDELDQDGPAVVIEHRDVQQAFENILETISKNDSYKMILMVDGLDEFEGEHASLLDLMKSWVSKYPSIVKICASSREYSIFEEFFADVPKLRLHQLTLGDMSNLINARLKHIKFFASLPEIDADRMKSLISTRAEGVFLWVVMVVATIEEGLVSGDITNAFELEGSIQLCPNELDDLFPHLLKTVKIGYRPWAFKTLSLVRFAQFKVPELLQSTQTYPGVGLLDFMLLDETSPKWNLANFQPRSDTKTTDVPARLEAMRKKVIGRCNGFMSVITIRAADSWPANGDERKYAAITHRAVVEFLNTETAESFMSTYISSDFDPFFALCSTVLACLRFLEPSNYPLVKPKEDLPPGENLELVDVLEDSLLIRWEDLIRCGLALGQSGSPRFLSILDAIGDAIKRHLTLKLSMLRIRLPVAGASPHDLLTTLTLGNRVYEYSAWRRRQASQGIKQPMTSSMSFAFRQMIQYFHLDDHEDPAPEEVQSLVQAKTPVDWIRWDWSNENSGVSSDRFSNLLTEFFEKGLDLNWTPSDDSGFWDGSESVDGTPWTCWQTFIWAMLISEIPYPDKYGECIDRFLRQGADPDIEVFSVAPVEALHIERLTPQDGWVLLVPYGQDKALLESFLQRGVVDDAESRQVHDRMPAALIRESAPIYLRAKENGWVLTLRDLVALWFPQEDYFSGLIASLSGSASSNKDSLPPPVDHPVKVVAGIMGSPRGALDLGIYFEEMRVQGGLADAATTIRREVKVA